MKKVLEGIVVDPDCSNYDKLPQIAIEIDGIEYPLDPIDYVLRIMKDGQEQCVVAIMPAIMPESFKYVILGDVFMRRYYSYFDVNQDKVGFIDTRKLKQIS